VEAEVVEAFSVVVEEAVEVYRFLNGTISHTQTKLL
jgi:hypothetical protein